MIYRTLALLLILAVAVPAGAQPESPAATLGVGQAPPPLEVETWVKGERLDALHADKTYVVDFWATWAEPCKTTIPHLSGLAKQYRSHGIEFVGVAVWERAAGKVEPFVAAMGDTMGYAVAIDATSATPESPSGKMAQAWLLAAGIEALPVAFVVHKGKIAWIGHPQRVDATLAAIANGSFDPEAAAKAQQAAKELDGPRRALAPKLREHLERRDWAAALAEIDRTLAGAPGLEPEVAAVRFELLLHKGEHATAGAYGNKIVEGMLKDNAVGLNHVAWTIVDPESKLDRGMRNLALARKAAERAVELSKGEDWAILDTLALVCFEQGEPPRALELQEKAVKLAEAAGKLDADPGMTLRLEQFRKAVAEKK